MKKFIAAILILTATSALAGGPMGGNGNGNGNGTGTCTGTCTPQGQGRGNGNGPGNGPGNGNGNGPGMNGGNLVVGTDGAAYVVKNTTATGAATQTFSLTAYSATGATLWTVAIEDPGPLFLSGANLIKVSMDRPADTATAPKSTIAAISTASGATLWSKDFDGRATQVTPANGGVYAVIVVPAATTDAQPARTLVGISATGATLFTVTL